MIVTPFAQVSSIVYCWFCQTRSFQMVETQHCDMCFFYIFVGVNTELNRFIKQFIKVV